MLTTRSLTAALLAVGMAASAHAGIVWQGGMDDARRNAGAFITSPQGKVSGLIYSLDPVATGWKLNRSGTALQQQPFPLTHGPFSPLRPASQYGISGPNKAAVIDVPATVKVPGKSTEVPVRILEPLKKSTLAKSIVKAVPVIGTAYQIGELLDDLGMLFRNGEWFIEQQPDPAQNPVSTGFLYCVSAGGNYCPPLPQGLTPQGACTWFATNVYSMSGTAINGGTACRINAAVNPPPTFQIVKQWLSSCPSGYIWNGSSCVPSIPLIEVPITEQQASEKIETDASADRLISIINGLPSDPRVIDIIARELQDDPADEEVRWPSTSPAIAPTTFVVGDPLVTTTTNPDGSSVTQTTTTTATTSGDTVTFNTTTVTNTYNQSGQLTGTTTTTTTPTDPSNPNSPQQEDLECGLPGKPPCKIDEAGTPEPPVNDAEQTVRDLFSEWQACIDDIQACLPQLPDISWTFSLPSGCSPIPLPGFEKWGLSAVDICPYQPMIHNLMSMLWAAAGLFGAISIISRRRTSE